MSYAYYPGCSLHSTAEEYDRSFRRVCAGLGVELDELKKWVCCGSTPAHATSHLLSIALPAHNLSIVEKSGKDEVVVPCAACFSRFKFAQYEMERDEELSLKVNQVIGSNLLGKVNVLHPLEILSTRTAIPRSMVVRDLSFIKAVCYYGCLLTRPPEVMKFDVCEYPMSMDNVLRSVGIETLDWAYKTECCGATLSLTETDIVVKLVADLLAEAKRAGANAVAVACPLCHANLDTRQPEAEAMSGEKFDIPIFYFTQLIGLALGYEQKELGLDKHIVSVESHLNVLQGGV
jgi:heterodisulfide reductase subunit B